MKPTIFEEFAKTITTQEVKEEASRDMRSFLASPAFASLSQRAVHELERCDDTMRAMTRDAVGAAIEHAERRRCIVWFSEQIRKVISEGKET